MPELDDDLDLDLNDLDDDEDEEEEDESEEGSQDAESGNVDKRVRDLQSAKDKETARANKLQKELDALKAAGTKDGKPSPKKSDLPPEVEQWVTAARTQTRNQLFDSDPRLKEYGFSPELITGETPAEMRASFQALRKTVSKMEAAARKAIMEDQGGIPDLSGGSVATGGPDWTKMSSEEFNKFVDSIS